MLLIDWTKIAMIKRLDVQQTKTKQKKSQDIKINQNQNNAVVDYDFGCFDKTLCCYSLDVVTY